MLGNVSFNNLFYFKYLKSKSNQHFVFAFLFNNKSQFFEKNKEVKNQTKNKHIYGSVASEESCIYKDKGSKKWLIRYLTKVDDIKNSYQKETGSIYAITSQYVHRS